MTLHASTDSLDAIAQLELGRTILRNESRALGALADRLGAEFCRAVQVLLDCKESVLISGMGKAGLVGQKIMATLASTGTPSHFVHPAEALHGDLGRFRAGDCVILLSNSGTTDEIVRLLPSLAAIEIPVIGVTSNAASPLARQATVTLELGVTEEACSLGLAPSTSTTAMLALGDALALVTSRLRGFTREDFARFHPGGNLGLQLAKVTEYMRPLEQCCVAEESSSLRDIYARAKRPQRRSGAILLTDQEGQFTGIFTDSDFARLFERKQDSAIDRPIREVMTSSPITVDVDTLLVDAIHVLVSRKISELPVVDPAGRLAGLVDITDVLGLLPNQLDDHAGVSPDPAEAKPRRSGVVPCAA
ncbi:MAG: SIS domain-containing protein [Pirellulaceae bacterium]